MRGQILVHRKNGWRWIYVEESKVVFYVNRFRDEICDVHAAEAPRGLDHVKEEYF